MRQPACIEGNKQIYKRKLLAAAPTCVAICKTTQPTFGGENKRVDSDSEAGDGFYYIIPSQYLGSAALA